MLTGSRTGLGFVLSRGALPGYFATIRQDTGDVLGSLVSSIASRRGYGEFALIEQMLGSAIHS